MMAVHTALCSVHAHTYHALFLTLQCRVIVGHAKPLGVDPSVVGSKQHPHGGETTVEGHAWFIIFRITLIIQPRLFLIVLQ